MNLPSKFYFENVKTKEQFDKFLATGMLHELEPNAPIDWLEHQEMCQYLQNVKVNKEDEK